mmetsp:Transcript_11701/g.35081  ORF Transcript_11701/g.35081 Transcript_11701/m.35081 type:complete len:781 (-) Transcript_11701:1291-3633(-)
MGQASSSEMVSEKLRALGEGGAYAVVAEAVGRFDLSGAFLVEANEDELEDFLVSRCPKLEAVQRRRVLFELDCMKRREEAIRVGDYESLSGSSSCGCSSSTTESSDNGSSFSFNEDASDEQSGCPHHREAWRTEGPRVGAKVEKLAWDDLGLEQSVRRGEIVAYCAAEDSTFPSLKSPVALWRARFEDLEDCVELDESEVALAVAQYERAILDQARSDVKPTRGRQRIASGSRVRCSDDEFLRKRPGLSPCPEGDEEDDDDHDRHRGVVSDPTVRRADDSEASSSLRAADALVRRRQQQRVPIVGGAKSSKRHRSIRGRASDDSVRRQQLSLHNSKHKPSGLPMAPGVVTRRSSSTNGETSSSLPTVLEQTISKKPQPPELVKKKRGRPRKNPLVVDDALSATSEIEESCVVAEDKRKESSKPAAKKRKPLGRARSPPAISSASSVLFVEAALRPFADDWLLLPDPPLPPPPTPTQTLCDLACDIRPDVEMTAHAPAEPTTTTTAKPPEEVVEPPRPASPALSVDLRKTSETVAVVTPSHQPPQREHLDDDDDDERESKFAALPPPAKKARKKKKQQPLVVQPQATAAPQQQQACVVVSRPKRSLAGRRACQGCHSSPCARTSASCFRGVESANGRYVARGDRHRFDLPVDAARRYDMMLRNGEVVPTGDPEDAVPNFDDDHGVAWEANFFARLCVDRPAKVPLKAPGGRADCGCVVEDAAGRSWYVARDEETIADICSDRAIDAATALAANLRAAHFLAGPKLTLKSKLKHHTRVLLTF